MQALDTTKTIKVKDNIDLDTIKNKLKSNPILKSSHSNWFVRFAKGILNMFNLRENSNEIWALVAKLKQNEVKDLYTKGYKITDGRGGKIQIHVVRKQLKEDPKELFFELIEKISNHDSALYGSPTIKVTFITDNYTKEKGVDGGGLAREFMEKMMDGLLKKMPDSSFKPVESNDYILLKTSQKYENGTFPQLTTEENTLFENLGKLMMFCYKSGVSLPLGPRFHPALFNACLSLTRGQVKKPLHELTEKDQLNLCKALLVGLKNEKMNMEDMEKRFEYLNQIEQLTSNEDFKDNLKIEILQVLDFVGVVPDKYLIDGDLDEKKVKQITKDEVRKLLIESILLPEGEHVQFGSQLPAIHAIARGMYSLLPMGEDIETDYKKFKNKVQGSIERDKIVEKFILFHDYLNEAQIVEMNKKVNWLKEWLLDEINGATNEEVKKFLIYVTGSSSLSLDQEIMIKPQYENFTPGIKAHTCGFFIEISPQKSAVDIYNDHTRENFCNCLKNFTLQLEGFDSI